MENIHNDATDAISYGIKMLGALMLNKSQIEIEKVIYNKPATILYANGKKYISKAHCEDFDKEKGLLMCLAKASGFTHTQIKRIIANACDQTKDETTIEIQTLGGTKEKIKVEEK